MNLQNAHLQPRISKKAPFSVEVPGVEAVPGETIPRRLPAAKDGLILIPAVGVETTYDVFRRSARVFGNTKAVASRRLIKTHEENKTVKVVIDGVENEVDKKWTYFEMSPYSYKSFVEYEQMALQLGAGLKKLELEPGNKIHLYGATRPTCIISENWLAMSHGAASQSLTIVTAYDSLGEDGLKHSLVQTSSDVKSIKHIIWNSHLAPEQADLKRLKTEYADIKLISFEDLRMLGEQNLVEPVPPSPEDLCCIVYTSGSNGLPKGVPLTHKNVIAVTAGIN
ncbi:hypothetical protein BDV37DRAFT_289170 [Aspergillus pseudonomiae]|uniref:AMP-dependent synthetase/ligase domain-containing protein n=1 Tax=Aspergillus pseudonomiae TaxID=1506151 RepID=A0A5N7CVW2_9EURO|nr:uncharacterized protein BDV37DRAFT_289170 [Aspergillus pseudonomiae]KAE8397713.1 hypothetical protein BDV37DRAFT_289170 [Aspergillus pseudonomiae]